jgi:hypothetical protein
MGAARVIRPAQYHDIKGHDVEQFREPKTVTILAPPPQDELG